jgi:predicted metal-binding protein
MTQEGIEPDLDLLCAKAKELGAAAAVSLAAKNIVVDERVRLKCLVPCCPNYGTLMCPPNVMPVSEFREILARYHHAILIQIEIPFTQQDIQTTSDETRLADLFQTKEYEKGFRALLFPRVYDILDGLEAAAFSLGYRFAAALGASRCYVCEECPRQGPCKVPFRGRPSMEAMGIDVVETAKRAGLPIEFPVPEKPVINCLLLVD